MSKIFRPWTSTCNSNKQHHNNNNNNKKLDYYPYADYANLYYSRMDEWIDPMFFNNNAFLTQAMENIIIDKSYTDPFYYQTSKFKNQRPKKFSCPHCKVSFSNNGQLKGHVRIHTGERPFKCDVEKCGKSFTRNEELTRHKRIHTGLKPFSCEHCGKHFGRKDHLKKHTRTHFPQSRFSQQLIPLYPILFGY